MARALVPPEKLVLGISASSETPESILIKVGIAKRYGLDGIAIWRLGLVTSEIWDALSANVIPW
jgi:spore germination protein YaaH